MPTPSITTFEQFIHAAIALPADRIHEMADVFEFNTSEEVREQIYCIATEGSAEPFRSAMINLGFINY